MEKYLKNWFLTFFYVFKAPIAPPKLQGENEGANVPSWRRPGSIRSRSEQNHYQIQPPPRNFTLRESVPYKSMLFEVVASMEITKVVTNHAPFP